MPPSHGTLLVYKQVQKPLQAQLCREIDRKMKLRLNNSGSTLQAGRLINGCKAYEFLQQR